MPRAKPKAAATKEKEPMVVVPVRFDPDDLQAIVKKARAEGLGRSTAIRRAAVLWARS